MASVIHIRASGTLYTAIPAPEWGYTSIVRTGLHRDRVQPRGYVIWDDFASNDHRICRASFLLSAANTDTLLDIFQATAKGRGLSVDLQLPHGSGFFPYGPDKGDRGAFPSRLVSIKATGPFEEPWLHFRTEMEFVANGFPTYALPAEVSEGDLQIGTVSGLRYPPEYPRPAVMYGYESQVTGDGSVYTVDRLEAADAYETTLPMVCNQSKAAALINHLTVTVRAANLSIVAPANSYLLGREMGGNATYTCQWIDDQIEIKHTALDEFEIPLSFYRVS